MVERSSVLDNFPLLTLWRLLRESESKSKAQKQFVLLVQTRLPIARPKVSR